MHAASMSGPSGNWPELAPIGGSLSSSSLGRHGRPTVGPCGRQHLAEDRKRELERVKSADVEAERAMCARDLLSAKANFNECREALGMRATASKGS